MAQNLPSDNEDLSPSFSTMKGKKSEEDKVLLYHGFKIRFVELGEAAAFLYQNEERLYPRSKGFKGGEMLRQFLNECMHRGKLSDDILKKYGLNHSMKSNKGVNQ